MLRLTAAALAAVAAALALAGCASTSAPAANAQTHIGAVEVTAPDAGSQAFAVVLHDAVVRQAGFYGEAGRPVTLRIALSKVHFKNPVAAMLIGDENQTKGRVAVVDPATGQETSGFEVQVDAERGGLNGGSVALWLIGAFEPTGLVDMGSSAASAGSAQINHSGTAAQMSVNFATETLRRTYGDARAKAVAAEIQATAKARRAH